MRITQHHLDHYREHGFVIVENFLTPEQLSRSLDDIGRGSKPPRWNSGRCWDSRRRATMTPYRG